MQISEIRIKLVGNRTDRLKAFCTITFDNAFVVRDLKIIEGADGYFVAMPSRKLTDRCPSCGAKNHLRARFCSDCGARLPENRTHRSTGGRTKLHADVAHPVNSESRNYIQSAIVDAFHQELELAQQPGYKPTELGDDYEDEFGHDYHRAEPRAAAPPPAYEPPAPSYEPPAPSYEPPTPSYEPPAPSHEPAAPSYEPPAPPPLEPPSEPSEPERNSGFGDGIM